ncbi:MFS transporter, partial [Klebsiella pneumoniae]
ATIIAGQLINNNPQQNIHVASSTWLENKYQKARQRDTTAPHAKQEAETGGKESHEEAQRQQTQPRKRALDNNDNGTCNNGV